MLLCQLCCTSCVQHDIFILWIHRLFDCEEAFGCRQISESISGRKLFTYWGSSDTDCLFVYYIPQFRIRGRLHRHLSFSFFIPPIRICNQCMGRNTISAFRVDLSYTPLFQYIHISNNSNDFALFLQRGLCCARHLLGDMDRCN